MMVKFMVYNNWNNVGASLKLCKKMIKFVRKNNKIKMIKKGGFTKKIDTPIGTVLIEADEEGITALHPIEATKMVENKESPLIMETVRWLQLYFAGENPSFIPPIHFKGTPFQCKVWKMLLQIPYGETTTYGELARQISKSMSAQAIGQAVGHNPIAIIVPCHRVVRTDGSIGGYAYGVEMKKRLLGIENILL
jgi:methylated-DNA-[protein]-cysteine S-methyltransferase